MPRSVPALFTLSALMAAAIGMTLPVSPATAGYDDLLYRSVDCYRDNVREFESLSDRVRCVDRYTERVIDRLYSAANSLRAAARNPHNVDRLMDRYYEVVALQNRIETTLFVGVPIDPRLVACWTEVQRSFGTVASIIEGGVARPYSSAAPTYPRSIPAPGPELPPPPTIVPAPVRPSDIFERRPTGTSVFIAPRTPATFPRTLSSPYRSARIATQSSYGIPGYDSFRAGTSYGNTPSYHGRTSSRAGSLITIGAELMRMLD
ncbi:MAG: hypothetical protein AAF989_05375 [Planctomycetota bacterium]